MSVSSIQNFYEAIITRNWSATTGDFNVSVAPTISSGYIVTSPSDRVRREIVKFSATGTNAYGPFVTVSNIAHRGLGGTTAQAHTIGEKVRMNITAQHWDELIASAIAPTVDVGTTTTLNPGSNASVTNSGTDVEAVFDFSIPAGSTIYSGTSIPDNSVGRNGDWAFDTSVNSYVWYKSGGSWALVNSLKGATGDGNGIASIVKTNTVGLVDTYTITYDDSTTTTFDITNGATGATGPSGADGESFIWKGAYDNGTAYVVNDVVSYNGSTYICILATTANLPTNITYWSVMAQKGTDGVGSGDVLGPATNTADYIPQWNGTDSKTLKNGIPTSTFQTALGFTPVTNARTLTINGTTYDLSTDRSWTIQSGIWTSITGTRTSNTTITVSGDQTAIFKKGTIVTWKESSVDKVGMVSIPSTYSSPNTTITIIGNTCASIDSNSFKYTNMVGVYKKSFAVAGNIGATGTDIANAWYADKPYNVIGAELSVGTAGTTNSTTVDINKGGTTMFTTKPTLATTVAFATTPFTADTATALALGDKVTLDIDAVQTTAAVDLYVDLLVFESRYLTLS